MSSAEKKIAIIEIGSDIWSRATQAGNQIVGGAKQVKDGVVAGGKWIGGALQGEFNDKATVGQIFIDAAISMFPVAGEVTAARDLVAILMKMADDKKEASEVINWVKIILCLLPIIPIFGGILKGIGRLLITVMKDATKVAEVAAAILAFLRKMGYGNSVQFIQKLNFAQYQGKILSEFKNGLSRMKDGFAFISQKMGGALPESVSVYVNSMGPKLDELGRLADKMIPSAIKELDQALNKVRTEIIRQMNEAGAKIGGTQTKVMTTEARLSLTASKAIASKGHTPAPLSHFEPVEGYTDLRKNLSWVINTFSEKAPIEAKTFKPGRKININRVLDSSDPKPFGLFWGDKLPKNGTEWRLDCAVKSEWSKNGIYIELERIPTVSELKSMGIKVPNDWDGLKVWEGKIAEQVDLENKLGTGLLLPGGATQLVIDFYHPSNVPIKQYIEKISKGFKKTNWPDAVLPTDISTTVKYLEELERSKKIAQQGQVQRSISSTGRANSRNEESR
ncbi:hypothetical protein GPS47_14355 [Acinetobacter haemolyticus]|uniref:hypothetical protein n=1 Tax=Acinetobacter haemolyticus TaxID=29430 RepID=UPI001372956E|nr:hypothetical protein [Acinetobacter haemolyticus]NAS06734.1 hypothetical protein [Acinetobacter haemolyticus]